MKSCPDCTATYPDDYAVCPKDGAPLQDTSLWQIGTVVRAKYRIKARLGEGGMATVYKAHHELLDEFRALKVIKPELAHDQEFMERFKNEAIMARKLNHPNAVRVDDLDIAEDGLPFIAMELVEGNTLNTLIQRGGALPLSLVLDVAAQVCDALDAAHKLGLIHRDIKPDNVVLISRPDGPPIAKILDFGISRLREELSTGKGLTQTGMVIGTPEYMSPEQALGKRGKPIDGRSDLYSLGVVMYRMLTGDLPFQAESTVEMMLEHVKGRPISPGTLRPELAIPDSVSTIVMKALEKDREKRFSSGAEMAAAIRKARGSTTIASRKIDWEGISSAAASFGTERDPATVPPARPAAGPAVRAEPAPPGRAFSDSVYRTSARIRPARQEVSAQLIWTLVVVIVLIGCAFAASLAAWKHFQATRSARPPAAKIVPSAASRTPPEPERKQLTYEEQAKIVELNSLAEHYYREGGCDKALPTYQQVLQIDATNPQAYAAVQRCYAKVRNAPKPPLAPTPFPDNPQ